MWDLIVSVPDHCLSFYFTTLQTEFSIFQSDSFAEQKLRQDIQMELSEFNEQTYNAVDKEVDDHRYIEKQHQWLKLELSNCTQRYLKVSMFREPLVILQRHILSLALIK